MTWKRIVSLKIVAVFLKKVNNNTPVHIVDILAEDLSFCRGVIVGGYTANSQTYSFKTYTRHTQKSEKRERERERARGRGRGRGRGRERERDRETKTWQIRWYLGLSVFRKLNYIHVEYFSKITTYHNVLHVFQKPNGFTTKCRGSNFKESSMGPGNFSTKCLALEIPFFKLISIFIHGPRYFFYKMPWSSMVCQSWSGPWTFLQGGLTTKRPIKTHFVVDPFRVGNCKRDKNGD